ncbi:rho GTPase-activating protein 18-like [Liolophura sinensis]|uniref:rho GTPase-activating protein 18-like n=1 Tax=Liolophura sinensis TaxID=3198878 RepID=UPI0031598EE4
MAAQSHNSTATEHLFADYWAEYQDITTSKPSDEEEEISKTPDEGEQELDWLKEAGYGQLASTFEDGKELSQDAIDVMMSTLTRRQASVVKKRVDSISATMRKRQKHTKTDVRDIFANMPAETKSLPTSPEHVRRAESMYVTRTDRKGSGKGRESSFLKRGGYDMRGYNDMVQDYTNTGVATLSIQPKNTITRVSSSSAPSQLTPASVKEQEATCQFVQDVNTQNGSLLPKDDLPNFKLVYDPLGVTSTTDLSYSDIIRIKPLAVIELTYLLESHGILYSRRKPRVKAKDHGIFGVSLQTLLEYDRKRQHGCKVPLIFQQLIAHLDKIGLDSEGILRVPGSAGRVKQLRQDLEERFYQEDFSWEDVWPNDAAAVLKQLLRELPAPLLTHEYLEAFAQVESISDKQEQLKALNLLILVLPEAHRNTLLALLKFLQRIIQHTAENRMTLSSVAMIMAPNLFLVNTKSKNVRDIEVSMAAGTSNIVKMLIKYQPLLWTVPPCLITQIRDQIDLEHTRKSRDKSIMKFLGKKDKSDLYRKPAIAHESDFHEGVIRVQAPNLTKSCAAVQLDSTTTAGDIVAKFRRHDNYSPTWQTDNSSSSSKADRSHKAFSNPDNATFAEDNAYLFEIGGNIGERCLDNNTSMLELYRVNPNAEWVVKTRPV